MKAPKKYLNQFHKESTERKMKKLAGQKPISAKEAAKQSFEMHERIKAKYRDKDQTS